MQLVSMQKGQCTWFKKVVFDLKFCNHEEFDSEKITVLVRELTHAIQKGEVSRCVLNGKLN